jgi:putative ABC transport system substrate-binding protein
VKSFWIFDFRFSIARCDGKQIVRVMVVALLFALCASAEAQQPGKIPRIGYLSRRGEPTSTNPDPNAEAFRRGLRDLGYIEGKNILLEFRYAAGSLDRLKSDVADLVQLKVDALVSGTLPGIRIAKHATETIPIVIVTTADPVEERLIDSLARPGGNITGLTRLTRDLSGKRLELLTETVPGISRVGVLVDTSTPSASSAFKDYEDAIRGLNIQLQPMEVRGPKPDFDRAFEGVTKERVHALITTYSVVLASNAGRIAELSIRRGLPSISEGGEFAQAGVLMSYSANDADQHRRAASYIDKILKGAKPADLPVEQPIKFELVINLKTAKQIGLAIPPNVLARAERVIR